MGSPFIESRAPFIEIIMYVVSALNHRSCGVIQTALCDMRLDLEAGEVSQIVADELLNADSLQSLLASGNAEGDQFRGCSGRDGRESSIAWINPALDVTASGNRRSSRIGEPSARI